jgi:hypothetical protein
MTRSGMTKGPLSRSLSTNNYISNSNDTANPVIEVLVVCFNRR